MPDNVTSGSVPVATRSVTYSGDAAQNVQVVALAAFSGSDDAKTVADLPGDATNGLLVNLGANNDVTVSGAVSISGAVVLGAGLSLIGSVVIDSFGSPLPTGTNQIGYVGQGTAAAITAPWPFKLTDDQSSPVAAAVTGESGRGALKTDVRSTEELLGELIERFDLLLEMLNHT